MKLPTNKAENTVEFGTFDRAMTKLLALPPMKYSAKALPAILAASLKPRKRPVSGFLKNLTAFQNAPDPLGGLGLEPHKQHLLRRFLLCEWPIEKFHHRRHYRKPFCQFRNNTRCSEHADRQRGLQIPLLPPQQRFCRMVRRKSLGHAA
jgi:hypothetical protein